MRRRSTTALIALLCCALTHAQAEVCPPGERTADAARPQSAPSSPPKGGDAALPSKGGDAATAVGVGSALPPPVQDASKPKRRRTPRKRPDANAASAAQAAQAARVDPNDPKADRRELLVVGVYRPVEMSGRTVKVDREVYLQPVDGKADKLPELLNKRLTVHRRVPVPMSVTASPATAPAPVSVPLVPASAAPASAAPVSAVPAPASAPVAPAPAPAAAPVKPPAGPMTAAQRLLALRQAAAQRARPLPATPAATPAPMPTPASSSKPASAATAAPAPASTPTPASTPASGVASAPPEAAPVLGFTVKPSTVHAGGPADSDGVARPAPHFAAGPMVEAEVGQVEIFEIRDGIAVARVVSDALTRGKAVVPGADLPVVSSGDIARFVIPPPPPPPAPPPAPPPPLTADERARLNAENERARAEDFRRKNPRGKYERKVMRWKL